MVKWFNFWMCVWRKQEHYPRGCLHPHLQWYWLNIKAFMRASWVVPVVKNQPADAGDSRDTGFIPGLGISLGEGNGNPLQCSCLGNPMDRGAWQATVHGAAKSQTRLSTHTPHQEYYSRRSGSDREKQILYALTYMWNLKKKQNLYLKNIYMQQATKIYCIARGTIANIL